MNNKICKISLFSAILASIVTLPVDARIDTNGANRSYAGAYNQINAMRYQQEYMNAIATEVTTASATATLPVMVSDEKLASAILNNTSETTISDLDACAMIYPNGVFRWEIPESGVRLNQKNQCVAVISLVNASTNAVLATTTVAAGDGIKCNIDSFPETGMNRALVENTIFPRDAAPTMEDVEAVMNEEQKQNAGLKIAAGAIISGVAGNLLSKKDAGDTKMFGTGKNQLRDTAIGAVTGAGIMAASSYSGKVAGDTIKSTAVNAASGMIVGNMLAGANGSETFLEIKQCNISETIAGYYGTHDCIAGRIDEKGTSNYASNSAKKYLINANGNIKECDIIDGFSNKYQCKPFSQILVEVQLTYKDSDSKPFKEIFGSGDSNSSKEYLTKFYPSADNDTIFERDADIKDDTYYEISSAYESKNTKHAYIVFKADVDKTLKGYKAADLPSIMRGREYEYFDRNSSGSVGAHIALENQELAIFTPISRNASDGGLIDISNQGRAKGTMVGTAAGGAMGGFAGYQGAKSEITDRWTSAVREYEDSLSNFVCMTGGRFLSKYNDYVDIPSPKKIEQ